jgi:hypothetical protein
MVLAGTFAVFAVVGGRGSGGSQIRDVGAGLALGVLMDTFVVRTVLVPSTVVLLGRWNWWPSQLSRQPADRPGDDGHGGGGGPGGGGPGGGPTGPGRAARHSAEPVRVPADRLDGPADGTERDPKQSAGAPLPAEAAPYRADVAPGRAEAAPEQAGAAPEQAGADPGRADGAAAETVPGKPLSTPPH